MPLFELHTPQPCLCAYNQPAALMVKNPIDIISLQVEASIDLSAGAEPPYALGGPWPLQIFLKPL